MILWPWLFELYDLWLDKTVHDFMTLLLWNVWFMTWWNCAWFYDIDCLKCMFLIFDFMKLHMIWWPYLFEMYAFLDSWFYLTLNDFSKLCEDIHVDWLLILSTLDHLLSHQKQNPVVILQAFFSLAQVLSLS
jgi:hypothetical protein